MASASIASVPYRPPLATGTPTTSEYTPVNYATSTAQPGNTYTYLYYFIVPYLDAHVLSPPSWRYAYIFWIFVPCFLAIWTAAYQLKRWTAQRSRTPSSPTISGLMRQKSNSRFYPIRWIHGIFIRRLIPASSTNRPHRFTQSLRIYSSNINIGQFITLLTFTIALLALSLVGDDYISPTTCTWGGRCAVQVFKQGPPKSTYAPNSRRFRARRADLIPAPEPAQAPSYKLARRESQVLVPRATALSLNPDGYAPFTDPLLSAPNTDVPRTMWTLSSRFGLIAYAMIPFVVSIGLKSWPFNIFAAPWLTHYSFDRTSILHRWTGRLIWVWSTIHTITFAIQLSRDINPYGHMILGDVWQYYRFNWGVVAYIALTITVCFSFNPLRNRYYEFFYCSHVVLSIVFLVGCIIHYEPLWAWAVIGLGLWGAERGCRLVIWLWFNGFFGSPSKFWSNQPPALSGRGPQSDAEKTAPVSSGTLAAHHHSYPPSLGSLAHGSTAFTPSTFEGHMIMSPEDSSSSIEIPPGFALVQVLPGHVLRITHKMVKETDWRIGEYVLLCIPSVSWWQTHPYTICSSSLAQSNKSSRQSSGKELALLLRARQGFSKKFYEFVMSHKTSQFQNVGPTQISMGILVRCQISRPLGSSGRIGWDSTDSLVIVCGGSGISFGISALEEVCLKINNRSLEKSSDSKSLSTRVSRVRLVWIFREYAHLSWAALALKRCIAMVPNEEMQVDLHVSNSLRPIKPFRGIQEPKKVVHGIPAQPLVDEIENADVADGQNLLTPPHPAFLRMDSESDVSTSPSRSSFTGSITMAGSDHSHGLESQGSPVGFTDFEGENQGGSDLEAIVSANVKHEGHRRRKNTLTRAKERIWKPKGLFGHRPHADGQTVDEREYQEHPYYKSQRESGQMLLPASENKHILNEIEGSENPDERHWKDELFREIGIDLAADERLALEELSECVQTGRPRLGHILKKEVHRSLGRTLVACCGPESLSRHMRTLVSQQLLHPQPGQAHKDIDIYTEDFSY